jgi:hypothetical protein
LEKGLVKIGEAFGFEGSEFVLTVEGVGGVETTEKNTAYGICRT